MVKQHYRLFSDNSVGDQIYFCTNFYVDLYTFQYTSLFAAICYILQIENKSMAFQDPVSRSISNRRMFSGILKHEK